MSEFTWMPGIGDPSLGAWVIVALYTLAALGCWASLRRLNHQDAAGRERQMWRAILIFMIALGINKQLDIQTALTELGRVTAQQQGWYEQRRIFQELFIGVVAIVCLTAIAVLAYWTRHTSTASVLAMVGTSLLLAFVAVRGASFHHIDHFLGAKVGGVKRFWLLEVLGILVVLGASLWRLWELEHSSRS